MAQQASKASVFSIPVLVAALGYFVDIYDLLLFLIIRIQSLSDLGLSAEAVTNEGLRITSWQMGGLLLGGILWGVLGDKKGRLSVLFGSILLYSLANVANGFVENTTQYIICRFIAGIGLAGELGAGITLVSEIIPKEKRGIATSLVAGVGLTGAVAAFFISQHFDWRVCYFIGGGLGLLLLILRISVFESGMFEKIKTSRVAKGNFFMLFTNKERFRKYILSIFIGLPTWYVVGILVSFSKEAGALMNIQGAIDPGKAVMYAYVAISIGDILIGLLSQVLKSRKKALYIFYAITSLAIIWYFNLKGSTAHNMYIVCALLGFGTGYWAIFVTIAAEQFGTNIRATATTTIPNMVRGALSLIILVFNALKENYGFLQAAMYVGIFVMLIAFLSTYFTEETFGKDLDYVEE